MSPFTRRLLFCAIAIPLGILVYRYTLGPRRLSGANMAKYLSATSAELNRGLPVMVDSETQLVSTTAMDSILLYDYHLISVTFSQNEVSALRNNVRPRLTSVACSTPATRDRLLKRGITLRYAYTDRNGYDLFAIDVTPRDCGL